MKGRLMKFLGDDGKKIKSWGFVISLPRDEHGKYQQVKRQGFPTREEADKALRKMLAELETDGIQRNLTVSEYLAEWLRRSIEGKRAARTADNYRLVSRTIAQYLGRLKLKDLAPHHIEHMYDDLSVRLSSSSVHTVHRILRAALNRAVKWGYLQHSPLARVDAPSLRTPRRSTLSVEQAHTALQWLKDHQPASYIGCYLAIYTGMRRGEICGLQWQDVDWSMRTLHVRRTRQQRRGQEIIGSTKTTLSERDLPVSEDVMDVLHDWHRSHQEHAHMRGESWLDEQWVMRQLNGEIVSPDTLTHAIRDAENATGMPHVSFHDLRHTHATILLEAGTPLKTVSERLGHSSIRITADIYAHVTDAMHKEAVENFDKAFRKKSEK